MKNKFFVKNKMKIKGFTLIELLVVVAIIGLLASVVLASVNTARQKAQIASTKEEMDQIRTAMEMYLGDHGLLPPGADNCGACSNPCDPGSWRVVMDSIVSGGYMSSPIYTDAWGNAYCYDNNYVFNACNLDTPLWSMGPNGNRDTSWGIFPTIYAGDDFGITIEPPHC